MKRTLHEHILFLEGRIQILRDRLTEPYQTSVDHERIHSNIQVAESALTHYRKAFELEKEITYGNS